MITALTDPNQLPNQLQDQQTFDANMASMIDLLPERARQENELAANLSAFAAGGAYAFAYGFDPSDAVGDPGPGRLRLNANVQNAATTLRIDPITAGGANIDSVFASIGAGTSVVKGAIRIVKVADPTRWLLFDILSVTASGGYQTVAVTPRGSSSSSPFVGSDSLMVYIDRAGDMASGAEVLLGGADITEATPLINFLSSFSSLYDNYRIELSGVTSSASALLYVRLATGGAAVSTAVYSAPLGPGGTQTGGSLATQTSIGNNRSSLPRTITLEILNANSASAKIIRFSGFTRYVTTAEALGAQGDVAIASAVSGFQLLLESGNFTGGKVRVYGRRN